MINKYVLSIDPSINFLGYAIHKNNALLEYKLLRSSSKHIDFIDKSRYMVNKLKSIINEFSFKGNYTLTIVTEIPQYWGVAGFIARESGAIPKLMFLCGMIMGLNDKVVALTPNNWKGQLPKNVVNNRLRKEYTNIDIANLDHNIVDAIGIGNYYINKNNKRKEKS